MASKPHCWMLYAPDGSVSGRFLNHRTAKEANWTRFLNDGRVARCDEVADATR